jgi:hypothetical protein
MASQSYPGVQWPKAKADFKYQHETQASVSLRMPPLVLPWPIEPVEDSAARSE